jgi:SAM-dependent methyltransferase
VSIAVLYPRFDHPAVEERYASWQTQMLLRGGEGHSRMLFYDRGETARAVAADIEEEHVLVVTDPLLVPSRRIGLRLLDVLTRSGATAAVPVSNEAEFPAQRRPPLIPYLTLRELQASIEKQAAQPSAEERVTWDASDPAIFLARTELLDEFDRPLHEMLRGADVAISPNDYVHRWSSLRGQTRNDLLDLIDTQARSVLEFGCGEAPLGAALKKRQRCRVVGIELDPAAAAIAKKRIDAVYQGDVREIVAILDERFDWIVGGDILEHLDEPWSFLADLRNISASGGHLLLSIPNIANASVVADLLRGRFDYVYMGLTCVGHLRFFTRASIEDMLDIAGWTVERIEPQHLGITAPSGELLSALDRGGYEYSRDDLIPTGYSVIARNDE